MLIPHVASAIPFFSHDANHIEKKIESFTFDQEGMKRMWRWYDLASNNVMDFLEASGWGKFDSFIRRELHMSSLLYRVTSRQNEYDLYCSMSARYSSDISRRIPSTADSDQS